MFTQNLSKYECIAIKTFFDSDIRYFRMDHIPTFEELKESISKIYDFKHIYPEYHIKYLDSDGDQITVNSDVELENSLIYAKELDTASILLKFYIFPHKKNSVDENILDILKNFDKFNFDWKEQFECKLKNILCSIISNKSLPLNTIVMLLYQIIDVCCLIFGVSSNSKSLKIYEYSNLKDEYSTCDASPPFLANIPNAVADIATGHGGGGDGGGDGGDNRSGIFEGDGDCYVRYDNGERQEDDGRSDIYSFENMVTSDGNCWPVNSSFKITWKLRNNGKSAWPPNCVFSHLYGPLMGTKEKISILDSVPIGNVVTIDMEMRAPSTPGHFTLFWEMKDPKGVCFGNIISTNITITPLESLGRNLELNVGNFYDVEASASDFEQECCEYQQEIDALMGMGLDLPKDTMLDALYKVNDDTKKTFEFLL